MDIDRENQTFTNIRMKSPSADGHGQVRVVFEIGSGPATKSSQSTACPYKTIKDWINFKNILFVVRNTFVLNIIYSSKHVSTTI